MSEMPESRGREQAQQKPLGDNALLKFVQQPRILLILLAAWAIVGFLVELFASADFSLNVESGLDGVLAGRLLSWQSIPLAVLYLYFARDPERYQRIFWLALIEQGAAIAAYIYHLIADDLEVEAIFIPLIVSASLGLLAFLNVFQRPEPEREYA